MGAGGDDLNQVRVGSDFASCLGAVQILPIQIPLLWGQAVMI